MYVINLQVHIYDQRASYKPSDTLEAPSMDLASLTIPLFFAILIFFLVKKKKKGKWATSPKLPPGPWKLPIIGNIHNLVGSQPHQILRDLALKYGPLMHLSLGEVPTVIVSSPRVAKEVMKTHDLSFATRPQLLAIKNLTYDYTDVVFAPYGHYWRQLRKICTVELLSAKRVKLLRPVREEEAENLIRTIHASSHSPVNLRQQISKFTNNLVTRATVGKGCKDRELFLSFVDDATKLAGGFHLAEFFPSWKFLPWITGLKSRCEISQRKLDSVLDGMIEERRRDRARRSTDDGEDLMDALLGLQQSPDLDVPMTTENVKSIAMDMFGAGSETSSTVVEWAMSEMIRNPRVMRKTQEEAREALMGKAKMTEADTAQLHYLKLVIKETLRLHPAVPLLVPRECREAVQIDGYHIPVKTRVIINAWAIARDPKYWDDPDVFRPERFEGNPIDYKGNDFEFLPFGSGRRMCPGLTLGIANVLLPLAQLLYHFDWKMPGGLDAQCLDMSEDCGITLRRKHELCLVPVPRVPLPN
ncbi:hypothetical protein ACLOJK_002057 [Asimina triloba]